MSKYEIIIYWDNEDAIFVAEVPELKGCMAHGETQAEALQEINGVVDEWLSIAKEKNWIIPEPKGRLIFA